MMDDRTPYDDQSSSSSGRHNNNMTTSPTLGAESYGIPLSSSSSSSPSPSPASSSTEPYRPPPQQPKFHHHAQKKESEQEMLMMPLMMEATAASSTIQDSNKIEASSRPPPTAIRSRAKTATTNYVSTSKLARKRLRHQRQGGSSASSNSSSTPPTAGVMFSSQGQPSASASVPGDARRKWCPSTSVRSSMTVMNLMARVLFWSTVVATVAAVFWYSYELKNNGTDTHLIAWFSAGAFVLLGFPISMYGIVMHLANYNQPNVQMYIVRILWMVPIYSIESWLCLRFHHLAIYIETLRDCYESYVLYSFLQFLIQVLGGEEELILMLKDKSPTRGVHMWGLQWCVKPWLMGQPVSRTVYTTTDAVTTGKPSSAAPTTASATASTSSGGGLSSQHLNQPHSPRPIKRVHWISPFFVRCKFGVLQYVLLKFVLSVCVMILELNGLYKEGDFTPKGGYLYICILTNLSQCWALYCLIFFYYATMNELSPIRPVGKFLSVKAVVFFTWWQSVCISMVYQMDMIPHYRTSASTRPENDWTAEDVAKGLQDYLICIEMFVASLVHTFVFPHTDYLPAAVSARQRSTLRASHKKIRLGRLHNKSNPYGWLYESQHHQYHHHRRDKGDDGSKNSNAGLYNYFSYAGTDGMSSSGGGNSAGDLELASQGSADALQHQAQPIHYLVPVTTNNVQQELDHNVTSEQIERRISEEDELDVSVQPHVASGSSPPFLSAATSPVDSFDEAHQDYETEPQYETVDLDERYEEVDDDDDDDQEVEGDDEFVEESEDVDSETGGLLVSTAPAGAAPSPKKHGFVRALLDSTIPRDVIDQSVGIVKGDYVVEKKTLLHHAATSDQYDIFSNRKFKGKTDKEQR